MRLIKYQKLLHYFNLVLVITTGILGIVSVGIFPPDTKLLILGKLIPFPISLASRTATLLLSIAMLTLAANLAKRRRRAYYSLLIIIVFSIFTHLIKGFDLLEASVSLITFISLILTRQFYRRPSRPLTLKLQLQRNTIFLLTLIIYLITTTLWLKSHQPRHIPIHYIRLSIDFSLIFLEIYFFTAFFAPLVIKFHNIRHHHYLAKKIIAKTDQVDYLNSLKLNSDKTVFLSSSHQSFLSYTIVNQYAFVLGDFVGQAENFDRLLTEFLNFLDQYSLIPIFYQVSPATLSHLQTKNFRSFPIGREALINLTDFSIENLKTSKLRQTYRKFLRRQYLTKTFQPPHNSQIYTQLKRVSDSWLQIPNHFERHFSVGYFSREHLDSTPVFAVFNPDKKLLAWINLHLYPNQKFATADLIRYCQNIPNGTMEFLFVSLFLHLKQLGYQTFSLGLAPLPPALSSKEKIVNLALKHLSFIFRMVGVANFKSKFATHWQTRYLVYLRTRDLLLYPKLFLKLTSLDNHRS